MAWDPAPGTEYSGWSEPRRVRRVRLTDLTGAGVPDNDPSAQHVSIAEAVENEITITLDGKATITDGYQEGVRWDTSIDIAALGYVADGTMAIEVLVEVVAHPAAADGLIVGCGIYPTGQPTRGASVGPEWVAANRYPGAYSPTVQSGGSALANLDRVVGLIVPAYVKPGGAAAGINASARGGTAAGDGQPGGAVTVVGAQSTPYTLFVAAGFAASVAAGTQRSATVKITLGVVRIGAPLY